MTTFSLETIATALHEAPNGPRMPYAASRQVAMFLMDQLGAEFLRHPQAVLDLLASHRPTLATPTLHLTDTEPPE